METMKEQIENWLADLKLRARGDMDMQAYAFYSNVEREIEALRAVGSIAARLYNDASDEEAWNALYEAISDAGLLEESDETPHEHSA